MTKAKKDERIVPWSAVEPIGPILRPAAAAAYLGIRLTSFYEQARRGFLPTPFKIGSGRATGVPVSWLNSVIADRAMNPIGTAQ